MRLPLFAGALLAATLLACHSDKQIADTAPAAQIPYEVRVMAILEKNGDLTHVQANAKGEYEILPGGLPASGWRLNFSAPYPATLKVKIDGIEIPRFEDVPVGRDPAATGYYKVIKINPSPTAWVVGLRPPDSKLVEARHEIAIASVSINPKYSTGPDHESPPLSLLAVPQKKFRVSVIKAGTGRGIVSSDPPGIHCGSDCLFDFDQGVAVRLRGTPAPGSSFSGWNGECQGSGECELRSKGEATALGATFEGLKPGGQNGCPAAVAIHDFTYLGRPGCASRDIAGHPTATLNCDAEGYFCCETLVGGKAPRCGGQDRQEFAADCLDFGPNASLRDSKGCYLLNP